MLLHRLIFFYFCSKLNWWRNHSHRRHIFDCLISTITTANAAVVAQNYYPSCDSRTLVELSAMMAAMLDFAGELLRHIAGSLTANDCFNFCCFSRHGPCFETFKESL